jgi:uncharacterized SAM-binding protein YcdF (DUF218 family)
MLRLLISPAFLIFAGLALLPVLLWWRRERGLAALAALLCSVFYLFTAPLPSFLVARVLQVSPAAECSHPANDARLVILTGGATGSARSADEVYRLERATFQRVVHGLQLAAASPDATVLISGGAEAGLTNEARIAERLALQLGWPAARLQIEETSIDTLTSGTEVARLLPAGTRPVLVTSTWHMRRALAAYRAADLDAIPCPVPEPDALIFPDSLVPQGGTLGKSSQFFKEVAGLLVYRMKGVTSSM